MRIDMSTALALKSLSI